MSLNDLQFFDGACFLGKAKVKLENKGDLSFFAKQDEAVSIRYTHLSILFKTCKKFKVFEQMFYLPT